MKPKNNHFIYANDWMATGMRLRILKAGDTDSVLQLANTHACFEATISKADLVMTKFFRRRVWIAKENKKVVGFAYGYFKDVPNEVLSHWNASKVGYIALMAVDPDYRNRGIDAALLRKLLDEFKKAGADLLTPYYPAEAAEAKKLYDKFGFEIRSHDMKKKAVIDIRARACCFCNTADIQLAYQAFFQP